MNNTASSPSNKLLPELFDNLDFGLLLCDINSLKILEYNQIFATWFHEIPAAVSLPELFELAVIKRINNATLKLRKYRFKLEVKVGHRIECLDFSCKPTTINEKNYLLIQGVVNSSELMMTKMIKDHSNLQTKNKKEIERAMKKAEAANNAKTMFIASMSHELRTPMNGILGMVQQFAKTPLNDQQKFLLDTIGSSGDQLLAIINQVLDFSKIEAHKVELHPSQTDIRKLVLDVIAVCRSSVEASDNLVIEAVFTEQELRHVLVDDIRLKQVLINLVNNAIKFTKTGHVRLELNTISLSDKVCELHFSIIDTGIGISQERISKLFKPFTQHDYSTTREYGGTGLGLTISSQLIKLMGSKIDVQSDIGEGSIFSFNLSLPICEQPTPVTSTVERPAKHVSIKGKTVLVVDDNRINRRIVSMALDKSQVKIIEAENGEEGVKKFINNKVDIILMDCLMPIMDGFEATKKIRELEANNQHTLIFALSASASSEIGEQSINAGMDDIMLKPFKFDELLNKITQNLS
ncbi:ATP-binding protein [Colwellia psychrerythraea]|uniref:histidine kinase n=1 Tax=Colwellia psychrerythraea TaxID=28229 RepID=A0A099KMS6_COLPS|nr:ATP-binding protein [Colwellia psychrerythraea]KGJ91776.1 histidine kinase [Colwellia psychrerythraea]